jgi:two-component system sensor kinase FixL
MRAAEVVRHMRRFVKKETAAQHGAIELADVVRDVVALVQTDAASQGVEIVSIIDAHLPAVWGDRLQLRQVLLNLLLNALDAMSDSQGARTVTISARSRDEIDEIAVSDLGHGLEDA